MPDFITVVMFATSSTLWPSVTQKSNFFVDFGIPGVSISIWKISSCPVRTKSSIKWLGSFTIIDPIIEESNMLSFIVKDIKTKWL